MSNNFRLYKDDRVRDIEQGNEYLVVDTATYPYVRLIAVDGRGERLLAHSDDLDLVERGLV